jgi:hypothetical protein
MIISVGYRVKSQRGVQFRTVASDSVPERFFDAEKMQHPIL